METSDVVIAGAGIIGLALALDLALHGQQVSVFDRGLAMHESSWAAAGMLAANDPHNPPELAALAELSLREYPAWLAKVEYLSGNRVPLCSTTTLQASAAGALEERVSEAELQSLAPGACSQDYLRLDEQSLDPRDLCMALPLAARAAGVRLFEKTRVVSFDAVGIPEGIHVETTNGGITARHLVHCTGAWAGSSFAEGQLIATPQIGPRKGQMVAVRLPGPEWLNCVLRTAEVYLVPRGDGRVIVGATVEDCGFDKTVEPQAIAALLRSAAELWPPIARAEVVESWAGLRPGSADDLPVLGRLGLNGKLAEPAHPHIWIAAGHFRNGILLAPGTARVLSQRIRGEQPEIDLTPFAPGRFDRAGGSSDKPLTAAL